MQTHRLRRGCIWTVGDVLRVGRCFFFVLLSTWRPHHKLLQINRTLKYVSENMRCKIGKAVTEYGFIFDKHLVWAGRVEQDTPNLHKLEIELWLCKFRCSGLSVNQCVCTITHHSAVHFELIYSIMTFDILIVILFICCSVIQPYISCLFLCPNICIGQQEFWESVDPSAAPISSWCRGHEDLPHLVWVPGSAGLQELHSPHHSPGNGHPPARRQPQQSIGYHMCMCTLDFLFFYFKW